MSYIGNIMDKIFHSQIIYVIYLFLFLSLSSCVCMCVYVCAHLCVSSVLKIVSLAHIFICVGYYKINYMIFFKKKNKKQGWTGQLHCFVNKEINKNISETKS